MPFPPLPDWLATARALHQAAMLFGPIHNALLPPRNNYLHLPMFVAPTGLESQRLPLGGRLELDFVAAAVHYRRPAGETTSFALGEHTQTDLFGALLAALQKDELAAFFGAVEGDSAAGMLAKLHADESRKEFLTLADVSGREPLVVDSGTAKAYAEVLYAIYTGVARFRARLGGHMTPIVVWPEHFDLSTLWFPPGNPEMDDSKPHINIGFAPYTPDQFDTPYLYAYAYPYPEPFVPPMLPEPALWHHQGWRGVVVTYADLTRSTDPVALVEEVLADIYEVLRSLL